VLGRASRATDHRPSRCTASSPGRSAPLRAGAASPRHRACATSAPRRYTAIHSLIPAPGTRQVSQTGSREGQ
jgi:hypothetical protein